MTVNEQCTCSNGGGRPEKNKKEKPLEKGSNFSYNHIHLYVKLLCDPISLGGEYQHNRAQQLDSLNFPFQVQSLMHILICILIY